MQLKINIMAYLVFSTLIFSQAKKITFIVDTNLPSNTDSVFLTGSEPSIGMWHPSKIKLNKISDSKWSGTFSLNKNDIIEYKFTLGSWQREALNSDGTVPGNFVIKVQEDTTIYHKIVRWKNSASNIPAGKITGTVEYIRELKGEGIKPRDIIIWLPPDYYADTTKRYPVLYMHDGQNIFDPKTATFGVDWQADEAADSLIKKNKIEKIIIVGIYNTPDRTAEYSYNDTGFAYMNFIIHKLKPLIDSRYRTLPDRENTATIGSSMGGLVSLMLLWEHHQIFSKGGCFSPAVKIWRFDYLSIMKSSSEIKRKLKFYFFIGGDRLEQQLKKGLDETITFLKENGYENDFVQRADENETHSESSWAKYLPEALIYLFPKN